MAVTKNLRDGELKVEDGTTPVNSVTVALDEGDLSYEETKNVINVLDRGTLSHMRSGDDVPVKVSFTLKFVEFLKQSAGTTTIYEALKKIGGASAWTTTNTDGGGVYTLKLVFTISTPVTADKAEIITFNLFHHTSISFKEGDEYDTLAVDGEAFITAASIAKES